MYDKDFFENEGIKHNDLFFVDGSTPPDAIVEQFFKVVDAHFEDPKAKGIAIHCKAGLGRTGTLIGLWAMKTYQIPAEAFIGWIRIARPGSILGPQQFYLPQMEKNYIRSEQSEMKSKIMSEQLENSPLDKHKAKHGELNQANYLILAKENSSPAKVPCKLQEEKEIKEDHSTMALKVKQK